jgi:hypothetical protein
VIEPFSIKHLVEFVKVLSGQVKLLMILVAGRQRLPKEALGLTPCVIIVLAVFSVPFTHDVWSLSPSVSVNPSMMSVWGLNESFSVSVVVSEVTDLYACEIHLYYDSAFLNGTSMNEGSFLKSQGNTFFIPSGFEDNYNTTHGHVGFANSLLGNFSGVSGTGVIATVTFRTKHMGSSSLTLADTKLTGPNNQPILHLASSGTVDVVAPTFRLLAVEANFSNYRMRSGQYFIRALLNFTNWNNSTNFVSYIELLSLYGPTEIFDDCKRSYRDKTSKSKLKDEINNFLGAAQPGETTVFYYCGDGGQTILILDEIITANELNSWLKPGVIVILDCCNSGSWVNDGISPGGPLGTGRVVLCSSRSNQSSWSWSISAWTLFTGKEKTPYVLGGPWLPLGVIGGFFGATDANGDGWISASEDFAFAKPSTEQYELLQNKIQTPVSFNGLGFDPLLVLIPQPPVASISFSPNILRVNETTVFNASASQGNITKYEWDFGDGNKTETTFPTIAHSFSNVGNYGVSLNVTNDSGWNSTTADITITYVTDLNRDKTVNILDIFLVANAFGSKPDDPNWNATADLNKDGTVNILDIFQVAWDFGKTV